MAKSVQKVHLSHLVGYLAIPHELLHVLGYRLVGKRCIYHWGQPYITLSEPLPLHHRLVGLLLPCFVFGLMLKLIL